MANGLTITITNNDADNAYYLSDIYTQEDGQGVLASQGKSLQAGGTLEVPFGYHVGLSLERGILSKLLLAGTVSVAFNVGLPLAAGITAETVQTITATPDTVDLNSTLVLVDLLVAGPTALTLPVGTTREAGRLVIKDAKGDASVNNITVTAGVGDTIDGAAAVTLSQNGAAAQLIYSNSVWYQV